jgi:hypothetical protein
LDTDEIEAQWLKLYKEVAPSAAAARKAERMLAALLGPRHVSRQPKKRKALQSETPLQKLPTYQVAREANVWTLAEARKRRVGGELRTYVDAAAGSLADRDPALEALSLDVLFGAKGWK